MMMTMTLAAMTMISEEMMSSFVYSILGLIPRSLSGILGQNGIRKCLSSTVLF
jgi:hypothetical protein